MTLSWLSKHGNLNRADEVEMKKLLNEPLLHFLVVGALLFGFYSYLNPADETLADNVIVISAGDINRLTASWAQRWDRPPTEDELKGLIDAYVREEVYYREALALGLDKNDTVLRRRLMQKMEFLSDDIADLNTPKETDLQKYFTDNLDKYELPDRVSFTHIYFSYDKRGEQVIADAEKALATIRMDETLHRAPEKGDTFILQYDFAMEEPAEITRIFGEDFSKRLFALEQGPWQGPVISGYGLHLVRVVDKVAASLPEFADVVDQVRSDWEVDQRERINKEIYKRFRERYEVIIDLPSESSF
jgi:hypothetical protein